MNTNRDQYIQTAIGSSVMGLVKDFVLIAASMVIIVACMSFINQTIHHHTTTSIMVGVTVVSLCLAVYLLLGGATPVRSQFTHYVLMVCGSGGHTAEMIQMIERSILSEKSSHRRWAVGKDDDKSFEKVMAFESRLLDRFSHNNLDSGTFDIVRFGRARYVHQSWLTTPFTIILSLLDIVLILAPPPRRRPHPGLRYPGVIVTNGPGTGFLFLLVARALKIVCIVPPTHMRTIYVESWARVKSLSLTGKLIWRMKIADRFIIQAATMAGPGMVLAENLLVRP